MGQKAELREVAGAKVEFGSHLPWRLAILVLLRERESHGYELADRLADLGFDFQVSASLYRVLRGMDKEGLTTSSWDTSRSGGPPRRVYALTPAGNDYLDRSEPQLRRQRDALDALLSRYQHSRSSWMPTRVEVVEGGRATPAGPGHGGAGGEPSLRRLRPPPVWKDRGQPAG